MGYPKITFNNNTVIDLTNDNVNSDTLLSGYIAHDNSGNVIYGNAVLVPPVYTAIVNESEYMLGSCADAFYRDETFNSPVVIGNNVITCDRMFSGCISFNQPVTFPDSVENCYEIFYRTPLNSTVVLGNNIKNCAQMFYQCNYFNKLITIPNTALDCSSMFQHCPNFNQSVTIPEGVTNCFSMFCECYNFNQPITLPNSVDNCVALLYGSNNFGSNIYINNRSMNNYNVARMVGSRDWTKRVNIFCNNIQVLNRTDSSSIVGNTITWTSTTNGFYNATYNVYIYYNYTGT